MNLLAVLVVVLFLGAPASGQRSVGSAAARVCMWVGEAVDGHPVDEPDEVRTAEGHRLAVALCGRPDRPRWQTLRGWGRPAPRAPNR